jgi:hypothetical protein
MIRAAGSTLTDTINDALEQARPLPNGFPASEQPYRGKDGNEWLSAGVVIAITRKDHPEFFDDLETMGEATFEILPNAQGSRAPKGPNEWLVFCTSSLSWSFTAAFDPAKGRFRRGGVLPASCRLDSRRGLRGGRRSDRAALRCPAGRR